MVECAPHLRLGGHTLDVRGPALDIARRMEILGALREGGNKLTGVSFVDAYGEEIYRSMERPARCDNPDLEILRDNLCRILHQAVAGHVEFLFGETIASITQDDAGVEVGFASAASRRFDLVIGADGSHSEVRRLVFGPERDFLHGMGVHTAAFGVPNFLGFDHWQVIHMNGDNIGGMYLAADKDSNASMCLSFISEPPLDCDHRDIAAQKRLVAERFAGAGWEFPRILAHMHAAPDFYFESTNQIRMERWSRGRVALVGDAGYSISPATGQGTTVAMVGAYVLAGELAVHASALVEGVASYEAALRGYVERKQDFALDDDAAPLVLRNYRDLLR